MAGADKLRLPTTAEVAEFSLEERRELAARLLGTLPLEQQAEIAAGVIGRVPEDQNLPLSLFSAYAARMPLATFEVTPLRRNPDTGDTEVALTQRPPGDWWEFMWHLAGVTAIKSDMGEAHGDYDFSRMMGRIFGPGHEFNGTLRPVGESHLFHACPRVGKRGPEVSVFHWVEVEPVNDPDRPMVGQFFNAAEVVVNPPEGGLIIGHADRIVMAAADFAVHQALRES